MGETVPVTADFTVRPARPSDARALAELRWMFKQGDNGGRPPEQTQPLKRAEAWIRDRLENGRWLAWVAETDRGQICGHLFLQLVERMPEPGAENAAPIGYATNFFVTPAYRGRDVGAALLDAMRRHAEKAQLDTLIAWPSDRSSRLWQRAGFGYPEELLELPLDS